MVSVDAINYIKGQLNNNISELSIRSTLLANGWNQIQVDEAFNQINAPSQPQPSQNISVSTPVENPSVIQNTSGTGDDAIVPEEIKGWSWAGFLMGWVWGISNHVWISLLELIPIPFISLMASIFLGIKGNELAWKKKHWESVEQFKKTQRTWVIWGLVLGVVGVLVFIVLLFFSINLQKVKGNTVSLKDQIAAARCVNDCKTSSDVQICMAGCQEKLQNSIQAAKNESENTLMTNSIGGGVVSETIMPTVSQPTTVPTKIVTPITSTVKPTVMIKNTPTNTPVPSKFKSNGVVEIEKGVTAEVTSAELSAKIVTIKVTFKNTSTTKQVINLVRMQLHDPTLGTGIKENYFSESLNAGDSVEYTLSFDALPRSPYLIEYATLASGELKILGTYTP